MTCAEFRERCHTVIDAGTPELADEEMLAHAGTCQECPEFFRGLIAVEEGLRQIPRLAVPAPLLDSLRQIGRPQAPPAHDWRPDAAWAARYLIPGLILWGTQWLLPEGARPLLLAAITFIGVFTLVTSILRPRILGSPDR